MPITPTYPGVYVEELPSVSHSVSPAPTSVTAFVGYTHPLKTTTFNQAVQLFSFADYQANFGGFFSHPLLPDYMGQAVAQFFLNGGSTAWVVGLPSSYYALPTTAGTAPAAQGTVTGATATVGAKTTGQLVFTALEPTALTTPGAGIQMTLTFSNLRQTANANDTADIAIVYGTTTESYRRVTIGNLVTALAGSALVTVAVSGTLTAYPAAVTPGTALTFSYASAVNAAWTVINPLDFAPVFADNSSLDKVSVINLVAMPGITGTGALTALSNAVAFCERKLAFLIIDPPPYAVADTTESKDPTATALAGAAGLLAATSPASPDTVDDMLSGGTFFPQSPNCALYFPWVQTADPVTGQPAQSPPAASWLACSLRKMPATACGSPRWPGDCAARDAGRGALGPDDRPSAGSAEPGRHQLPAPVSRHRHGDLRRVHAGPRQPRLPAVLVRVRAPDGAVHRAVAVGRPEVGRVRAERPAAVDRTAAGGPGVHAQPLPAGRVPRHTRTRPSRSSATARRRPRPTSTTGP